MLLALRSTKVSFLRQYLSSQSPHETNYFPNLLPWMLRSYKRNRMDVSGGLLFVATFNLPGRSGEYSSVGWNPRLSYHQWSSRKMCRWGLSSRGGPLGPFIWQVQCLKNPSIGGALYVWASESTVVTAFELRNCLMPQRCGLVFNIKV
jgi:hypothetical protein